MKSKRIGLVLALIGSIVMFAGVRALAEDGEDDANSEDCQMCVNTECNGETPANGPVTPANESPKSCDPNNTGGLCNDDICEECEMPDCPTLNFCKNVTGGPTITEACSLTLGTQACGRLKKKHCKQVANPANGGANACICDGEGEDEGACNVMECG